MTKVIRVKDEVAELIAASKDFDTLVSELSCLFLEEKNCLPSVAGIYIVYVGSEVLYVGRSINIKQRWSSHHKVGLISKHPGAKIAWIECDSLFLHDLEYGLIASLSPAENWEIKGRESISQAFRESLGKNEDQEKGEIELSSPAGYDACIEALLTTRYAKVEKQWLSAWSGLFDQQIRCDFRCDDSFIVEVKFQGSSGSVEQKLVHSVEQIKQCHQLPTTLVMGGCGYSKGCLDWALKQSGGHLTKVQTTDQFISKLGSRGKHG